VTGSVTVGLSQPLLDVQGLEVHFRRGRSRPPLRAVDNVSFSLARKETIGLVGESGSGKTTIGRAILGLTPIKAGVITFDGEEISGASRQRRRALSAKLQVVFQDPYSSLNPTRTVGQTLSETLRVHSGGASAEIDEAVTVMLEKVGLPPEATILYPSNFSGGQRQRIAIARALMVRPSLVICDEPTSALDLSVQAQILNLFKDLQDDFELSYLFISHDLAAVQYISHRIIVIYQGQIMEQGDARLVCGHPLHPYTRALLEAAPVGDPERQRRRRLARGTRSSDQLALPETGCPFAPRCLHSIERCSTDVPLPEMTADGRLVSCHRWRELPAYEASAADKIAARALSGSASDLSSR
jgi:oligopeptide/dipeptide ABC transporter ATP-binding protein